MHPEERLRQVARNHGGAFRRSDAIEVGLTAGEVRGRVRRGEWRTLHRGIYVHTDLLDGADAVLRTRLRASAAALAHPGSLVSHHTAAELYGLPLVGGADEEPIHLSRTGFPRQPAE